MHPILQKTLGGLSAQYYWRHFFFGAVMTSIQLATIGAKPGMNGFWVFAAVNTILYPYARFVYESVVGFVMGQNFFMVNALLLLLVKFITMLACWMFAMFIAPVGWAYLYYAHSRKR